MQGDVKACCKGFSLVSSKQTDNQEYLEGGVE